MKSPPKIVISQKILVNLTGAFFLLRLRVFAFLICLITLAGCGGGGGDDGNGPDNNGNGPDNSENVPDNNGNGPDNGGNGPDNNENGLDDNENVPDNLTFDIDLIFVGDFTEDQKELFRKAARRWEAIITSDIPDQKIVRDSDSIVQDSDCVNDASLIVDDLRIYAEITDIDGPHGTLALAGPEHVRDPSLLPVTGCMEFDVADINSIDLYSTIVHEMGHVLGFGTIWHLLGLLRDPSLDAQDEPIVPVPDTHFSGRLAIEAFDKAGGASYQGKKVPVENQGGSGSQDGHWRESVLGNEIMSPFVFDREEPLSAITIQSLADIGYSVDVSQADLYRLPPRGSLTRRAPGRRIHLENDIRRGPISVIDTNGDVVRIIE